MVIGDDQRLGRRRTEDSMRWAFGVARRRVVARPRDSMLTPAERCVRSVA